PAVAQGKLAGRAGSAVKGAGQGEPARTVAAEHTRYIGIADEAFNCASLSLGAEAAWSGQADGRRILGSVHYSGGFIKIGPAGNADLGLALDFVLNVGVGLLHCRIDIGREERIAVLLLFHWVGVDAVLFDLGFNCWWSGRDKLCEHEEKADEGAVENDAP